MGSVAEGLKDGKEWEIENHSMRVNGAVGPGDDERYSGQGPGGWDS